MVTSNVSTVLLVYLFSTRNEPQIWATQGMSTAQCIAIGWSIYLFARLFVLLSLCYLYVWLCVRVYKHVRGNVSSVGSCGYL